MNLIERFQQQRKASLASSEGLLTAEAEGVSLEFRGSPSPSCDFDPFPRHVPDAVRTSLVREQVGPGRRAFDPVRTAEDSSDRLDKRNRITLDLEKLRQAGFVVPGTTRSPIAEHFGQIKRPLLTNARSSRTAGDRLSLVMITSALPREGKTFCAVNLAISMSFEIDTSVLLVDADVMRPELLQRLGLAPQRGLLDLLTSDDLKLSDVVLQTNIPKLSILPAGLPNNMSSELLASDAMDALLLTLAAMDPNRVVIFDAPPLLVTTEAKVLASRMGQVVLVVAASSTPRSALIDAFDTVAQCPIVMSVLNKAPVPRIPLGYGY